MDEENKDMIMKSQKYHSASSPKIEGKLQNMPQKPASIRKKGVGICIISRGTVPLKWMMHMNRVKNNFPGGMFWKFITVERLSWASARSECVRKCRANHFQWMLFIDDDLFIPENTLDRLLRAEKDIITGLYWTKSENTAPVIFHEMGQGPIYDFELDKVIPIGGSGLGCCLINMDVFDKFDEAGIPYFVENWVYTTPSGDKMKCPIGEDHYFFLKSKEFGYQPYCDTGVLCDHYNFKNDKFYPGEEIVRELCKRKLKEKGRTDLIEDYDRHQRDPKKRTIVIYNNNLPFSGDELSRRGVGGSEHDIINLARIFAKKFNVRVYCQCLREGVFDKVIYKHNKNMLKDLPALDCDLYISSRQMGPLLDPDFKKKCNIKQTVLWGHDLAEDPMWNGFEEALPNIDKIALLSEFHKQNIKAKFSFLPEEKITLLRNGVEIARYKQKVQRIKGKCIYSSTPYRGLDLLLKIWPKIKKRVSHAQLHIFSSIKVYGEYFDDAPWEDLYNSAKGMEGVHYYGAIKQDRLAKEQMESELLLYPNTFLETWCNTAAECQTAGTPIITTKQGALAESVKEGCGILLENPYTPEYMGAFVNVAVDLLTNKDKWERMHEECLKQDFSWDSIAKQWIDEFLPVQSTEPPPNWDKFYEVALTQHQFNVDERRFNFIKQFVKENDKILDVGCGLGAFPRFLKESFPKAEVWGTEQSTYALDYCRQSSKTIFFANHPIENPDFEEKYFDVINCSHVLEFTEKQIDLIKILKRILKPGGILIIVTADNQKWPRERLIKLFEPFNGKMTFHTVRGLINPEHIATIEFTENNLNPKK